MGACESMWEPVRLCESLCLYVGAHESTWELVSLHGAHESMGARESMWEPVSQYGSP